MANCGTKVDLVADRLKRAGKEVSKEQLENEAKIRQMIEWTKTDPRMRAHMGLDPVKKSGSPDREFASWVVHRLGYGADPYKNVLSTQDINWLFAEMLRGRDTIGRIPKWATGDKLHAWINKVVFLPGDVWRRDILGGSDFFLDTQILRADHQRRLSGFGTDLKRISDLIEGVANVEMKALQRVLEPLERDLGIARQDLRELSTAPVKDKRAIQDAKLRVRSAQDAYDKAMRGEVEDPKIAHGLRTLRTISLALDGKHIFVDAKGEERVQNLKTNLVQVGETRIHVDPETGKEVPVAPKDKDLGMPVWTYERQIDRKQLAAAIKEQMGEGANAKRVSKVIDEVADFLDGFAKIARSGFKAERENMVYQMMRGEARMTRAEATKLVDSSMKLEIEDIYFPRRSLEAKQRLERMSMEMEVARDKKTLLERAVNDPEAFTVPGESTPSVLPRKYNTAMSDTSHNIVNVLSDYGTKMINYWHNNHLALQSNRLLDRLWKARKGITDKRKAEEFEAYIEGVTKYVADFVDRSKNSGQGGKMHEVMKILVGWKAGLTMGFLNPSTPLLNIAEGQALILTRTGRHYFSGTEKKNEWATLEKEYGIGREYTDVTEGQLMGTGDTPILDGRGPTNIPNEKRKLFGLVEIDTNKRFLSMLSNAVSEVAKRAIILQRKAENANRGKAFRAGALMEFEFLQRYRPEFLSSEADAKHMLTPREMESMGLTHADFKSEATREKAWKKLVKERVTRAGFENVYQTQWNYNQVARHHFERTPIGKMGMMFQHYPLSWISAWRRTYEVLSSLQRAGSYGGSRRAGMKAMVAPTTRDGQLSPLGKLAVNPEAMFTLVAGSIAFTLAGLRYGSGIVLGQMFQHPVSESVEDMIKYVHYGMEGKHEQKKSLFWSRGLVNNFTGPLYTDLMDAISLGALKAGIEDGDMPRWTSDILRGTVGFRPNELLLTEFGRRKFSNAWDVMYESFLFGGASVVPKATRLAHNTPGISKWLTGKDATLKDFSYQAVRATGVRDERSIEGAIKRRLDKEPKT